MRKISNISLFFVMHFYYESVFFYAQRPPPIKVSFLYMSYFYQKQVGGIRMKKDIQHATDPQELLLMEEDLDTDPETCFIQYVSSTLSIE